MPPIIQRNPFREMAAMQSVMDRLFDETWRSMRGSLPDVDFPIDLLENDTEYVLRADLPGVDADKISIHLRDNALTIATEFATEILPEGARSLMTERPTGTVTRTISLNQPVDSEQVEAHYEVGVLRLRLPKTAQSQPRQIQVKHGS